MNFTKLKEDIKELRYKYEGLLKNYSGLEKKDNK